MTYATVALWILGVVLIVIGIVGVLLPALPGPAFVLAGIMAIAAIDRFQRIGLLMIGVLMLLTVLALVIDYLAAALGARRFGGSRWGTAGAVVGVIAGLPFGFPGVILGPAAGATTFELLGARKESKEALRAGLGTFLGFLLGTAIRYAIVFSMLGLAVVAYVV